MCDQQSLRPACAYAQSDQSLCLSLEFSMIVKLLTERHLEFLSLKGGCTGSSESTLVKMSNCWKSRALAQYTNSVKLLESYEHTLNEQGWTDSHSDFSAHLPHWSMYTSIWWYLRVLPLLHRPEVAYIGVNTIQKNMPYT